MRACDLIARLAALAVAAALAACDAETVGPKGDAPTQPIGRLRVVNAVADTGLADRINVNVDRVPFGVNLAYGAVAPSGTALYYPAYQGARQLSVRRTSDTTVRLLDATVTVAANADQTVILSKSGAGVTATVLTDANAAPTGDSVRLRLVQLSSTQGNLDVYVTAPNASIAALAPTLSNLAPGAASAYLTLPIGTYQVRFTTAGTKNVVLTVNAGTLAAGAIRTILALDPQTGTALAGATLTDR